MTTLSDYYKNNIECNEYLLITLLFKKGIREGFESLSLTRDIGDLLRKDWRREVLLTG